MKKLFVAFVLLLFSLENIFSQEDRVVDSLLKRVVSVSSDTTKAWIFSELSSAMMNSNPYLAKYYGSKSREIFERNNNTAGLAIASLRIAAACRMMNEEAEMLQNVKIALKLAEQNKNDDLLASCYHEMALIANSQNDLEKSEVYNIKALDLRTKLKQFHEVSGLYNNLGILFAKKNNWKEAIKYFRKALETEKSRFGSKGIGNELNNIGVYYMVKGQFDSALYFLSEGKKSRMESKDKLGISGSDNNFALMYMELNQTDKALCFADTSYAIAREINSKNQELEVLLTYYSIYNKREDYKNALLYFRKHEDLRKLVEVETNNRKLSEIQSSIEMESKEKELLEKNLLLKVSEKESAERKMALWFSLAGLGLAAFVIWYVLKANKRVKAAHQIISEQKKKVTEQKVLIEEKHKDITDSIFYAQKIQQSVIIPEEQLQNSIPESFVFYAPRDIVSGDFYWFGEHGGYKILAVADCTGHGVPGAFMSLIGISSLNQIVLEKGITSPAKILDLLREKVIASFNQAKDESHRRDGMDIGVLAIKGNEIIFSGANNSCILLREKEITLISTNKQPVGYHEHSTNFNEEKLIIQKGDSLYLFTDGIVDQFGGDRGKKLKIKYFKEWLIEVSSLEMKDQKGILKKKLEDWKNKYEQTDDICVAGIKV